jgi:hypothetical protein
MQNNDVSIQDEVKPEEGAVETSQPSVWQMLLSIIDRPKTTFKAVLARKSAWMWALPLLILLVCLAVTMVFQAPYSAEISREQVEQQLASMSSEQAEVARAQMERFSSVPAVMATSLVTGAILVVLATLSQTVLLYFGTMLTGGEVKFGQMFQLSAWTRLPYAINYLVLAVYIAVAQRMVQYPGLSSLIASGELMEDSKNPMVAVLGRIDPFWIWHLILVAIALSAIERFNRRKSIGLTVVYAILTLVSLAIPSLLFGGQIM